MKRGWLVCVGFLILGCGAHAEPNRPVVAPSKTVRVTTTPWDPRVDECLVVVGELRCAREDGRAKTATDGSDAGGIEMFGKFEALPTRFPQLHSELGARVLKLSKASTKVLDYVDAEDAGQTVDRNEFNATLQTALVQEADLVEYCNPFLPTGE